MQTTDYYELKENDITKPFAFVSYSWVDAEAVYKDIKILQNMGYNLWIDKEKMNERKDSWSEQALSAIHDIDCRVLFFYMSSNSLASESCFKEIQATLDDISCNVHGEALPVVLIEVEKVPGKASDWIKDLRRKMELSNLNKDERTKKCIVLSSFRSQFFEDRNWNEKIRIGTMEELGEEMYYNKLISNLPEIVETIEPPKPYVEVKDTLFKKIKGQNNVWLTDKEHSESDEFSIYERLYGVKLLTLVNYAGTSFLSGIDIAHSYTQSEQLREWFEKSLANGNISVKVVLTNPSSAAAIDAEKYKMYPDDQKCEKKDIIRMNLNTIWDFCKRYPKADLKVYITDVALPYGIMMAENPREPKCDYIKVDIYAPVIASDKKRPSFYLMKSDPKHLELYKFFNENVHRIRENSTALVESCLDISWLFQKPIIHRGSLSTDLPDHSFRAFRACIAEKLVMEVDLLEMRDGELIVQRERALEFVTESKRTSLSRFKLDTLYQSLRTGAFDDCTTTMLYEMLTFSEFLNFVKGRVGLLIELKDYDVDPNSPYHGALAMKVLDQLKGYGGRVAIQSANPYLLREVRKINCLIPIGQISLDFENKKVEDTYRALHLSAEFLSVIMPDFINYDLDTMRRHPELRQKISDICRDNKLPLFCWNVKTKDDVSFAINTVECDNYIVDDYYHLLAYLH